MTKKLPPANDWQERDIDDWNTTTFTSYMQDKHRELFGCEYVPMRNWAMEQGMLGRLIGTKARKGSHSKEAVKRFIDEAFETYRPTKKYPGTNFGFIYSYRRNILQRIEAEEVRGEQREKSEKPKQTADDLDRLSQWF